MNFRLEVIGFNIESCCIAQAAGAHRIELCDNPGEGGTTPSPGFIKAARKALSIDLYPIIRPRGGDFLFNDAEFEIMKTDVQACKEAGCNGVVIGMLLADGSIDRERCRQLVELAYPMGVTFHRAFDRTSDVSQALEDIIAIGCERILTSGQRPNITDGTALVKALIEQANGRIIIMPGSGVRSGNILAIAEQTSAEEFHTSARILKASGMQFQNPFMEEDLQSVITNGDEVKKMIDLLKEFVDPSQAGTGSEDDQS